MDNQSPGWDGNNSPPSNAHGSNWAPNGTSLSTEELQVPPNSIRGRPLHALLPLTQAQASQTHGENTAPSRLRPMRLGSWGRRHSSFDSPREIPGPPYPPIESLVAASTTPSPSQTQRRHRRSNSTAATSASCIAPKFPSSLYPLGTPMPSQPSEIPAAHSPRSERPELCTSSADRLSTASLPLPATTPHRYLEATTTLHAPVPRRYSERPPSPTPSSSSLPPPRPPQIHTPPLHPPAHPFLNHIPAQSVTAIVNTSAEYYVLTIILPGFDQQDITVATRRSRAIQVMADKWDGENSGHYERRISFGWDAEMSRIHAEFDGDALVITIPRRIVTKRSHPTPHPDHMSYRSSSSSVSTASFSDFGSDSRRLSTDTISSTFSMAGTGPPHSSKGVSPATIPEDDAGDSGRSDHVGGEPIDEDIYERVTDDHHDYKMDGP